MDKIKSLINIIFTNIKKVFLAVLSKKGLIALIGAAFTFYVSTLIPFCKSSILPQMGASYFSKARVKIIGDSHGVQILKNKKDKKIYVGGELFIVEFTNLSDYPITVKDITFEFVQERSYSFDEVDFRHWIADYVYYGSYEASYLTRVIEIPKFNKKCSAKAKFYNPDFGGNPSKFEVI